MAFKPSERRSITVESTELDLRPIMNMMCILIPLLLSCTRFVKNSYLDLNLPSLGGGPERIDKVPEKEKPKIGLKLIITEKGMTIASNSAILGGDAAGGPTLPKKSDGKYDYKGLEAKLKSITKAIDGKGYEDERVIIITAEDAIEYQIIVTSMDVIGVASVKELRDPSTKAVVKQQWFNNISIGKILL